MTCKIQIVKLLIICITFFYTTAVQAYLSVHLQDDSAFHIINQRKNALKMTDFDKNLRAKLSQVQVFGQKSNGKKTQIMDGEMIDLVEDVHQEFHMTLNDVILSDKEKKSLASALNLVEFPIESVSIMGKFITLKLGNPDLIDINKGLSDPQMEVLAKVMPQAPHVSIYKFTDRQTTGESLFDENYGYVEKIVNINIDKTERGEEDLGFDNHINKLVKNFAESIKVSNNLPVSKFSKMLESKLYALLPSEKSSNITIMNLLFKTKVYRDYVRVLTGAQSRANNLSKDQQDFLRKHTLIDDPFKNTVSDLIRAILDTETILNANNANVDLKKKELINDFARAVIMSNPILINRTEIIEAKNNPSPLTSKQINILLKSLSHNLVGTSIKLAF